MSIIADAPIYAPFEISDNIAETPEKYLICYDVALARTGRYLYRGDEIGRPELGDNVHVYRFPEDVFSKAAMASFEGRPVTDDHPPVNVNVGNWNQYAKGHVQNIRRKGELLLGDLVITDPVLIDKIKNKTKRQISMGYEGDWEDYQEGFKQTNIIGNHCAVVLTGRAGSHITIKDSVDEPRSRLMSHKEVKAQMLASYIKDANPTPQEIAMAMKALDAEYPAEPIETGNGPFEKMMDKLDKILGKDKKARDKKGKDEDMEMTDEGDDEDEDKKTESKDSINNRLNRIEKVIISLDKKFKDADEDEDEDKKKLEDAMTEQETVDSEEEIEENEKEEEEVEKSEGRDRKGSKDSVIDLARHLSPTIAKLSSRDKALIKDALADLMGRSKTSGTYGKITQISKQKQTSRDSNGNELNEANLGKQWAAERHAFKETFSEYKN